MSISNTPTFKIERELHAQGYKWIVGVDEAGCGALAGPVVAGAVIFPLDSDLEGLKDSKLLSEKVREELYGEVTERSVSWASGQASVEEIEEIGIRPATYLAMMRAIQAIENVDYVLVDAWTLPDLRAPQRGIIKGDRKVKSIAAASIIAKVTRDRQMREHAQTYPAYGFDVHKGYGTAVHRQAIKDHGPCGIHRLSYKTFHPTLI
jgi:ribonuclease HII